MIETGVLFVFDETVDWELLGCSSGVEWVSAVPIRRVTHAPHA